MKNTKEQNEENKPREKETKAEIRKSKTICSKDLMKILDTGSNSSCSSVSLTGNSDVCDLLSNRKEEFPPVEINKDQLKERSSVSSQFMGEKSNKTNYIYLYVVQSIEKCTAAYLFKSNVKRQNRKREKSTEM
ncbi:hypothetical protein WA026_013742 [Henosepilachna vigintioctopunctata]|uniref:Uncharacterized protein n=1 Tax=Henosepilachna vigintioctopunctata TaxID=420089 RepID=A0AAW1UTQ8_9CUCU